MKHIKTYRSKIIYVPSNNERKRRGIPLIRKTGKRKPRHSNLPFA